MKKKKRVLALKKKKGLVLLESYLILKKKGGISGKEKKQKRIGVTVGVDWGGSGGWNRVDPSQKFEIEGRPSWSCSACITRSALEWRVKNTCRGEWMCVMARGGLSGDRASPATVSVCSESCDVVGFSICGSDIWVSSFFFGPCDSGGTLLAVCSLFLWFFRFISICWVII